LVLLAWILWIIVFEIYSLRSLLFWLAWGFHSVEYWCKDCLACFCWSCHLLSVWRCSSVSYSDPSSSPLHSCPYIYLQIYNHNLLFNQYYHLYSYVKHILHECSFYSLLWCSNQRFSIHSSVFVYSCCFCCLGLRIGLFLGLSLSCANSKCDDYWDFLVSYN